MPIARILHESLEGPRYALLVGTNVWPLAADYNFQNLIGPKDEGALPLNEVKILAPVVPSKIVCVGRNYREHAAELGNKMPRSRYCS
jgi:2-keto-4-pentenoate hydratase/2-oxohepta-3-ene-1,7-dioic acid hydratase in catechol pathway